MLGGQDDKLSGGYSILDQWDTFLDYFPAFNHKTVWCQRHVLEKPDNTNPSFTAYSLCQKTKCNETIKSEEENWHSFLISCCLMNHLGPSSCKMRSTTGNSWAGFEVLYFQQDKSDSQAEPTGYIVSHNSGVCSEPKPARQAPRPGGDTLVMTHRTRQTGDGILLPKGELQGALLRLRVNETKRAVLPHCFAKQSAKAVPG